MSPGASATKADAGNTLRFEPVAGDGRKEYVLVSPGVVGVKVLPLSNRDGGASKLRVSKADELLWWRWFMRMLTLPADSLRTRPLGAM